MGRCLLCGSTSPRISSGLGVCHDCMRKRPDEAVATAQHAHAESRVRFGLPPTPPKASDGIRCGLCMNDCRIPRGEKGFCGLVRNDDGHLVRLGGTPERGVLQWYYDPLPTNCVAWWFCPGCTGAGYPNYAYRQGPERGYSNLAVFYGACSLDCLYCQNWHYRHLSNSLQPTMSAQELMEKADAHISCVCYFGGDPSPQMPHALKTSELVVERAQRERRLMRVCWETNGYMVWGLAERAAFHSLESGGVVKFDLKAWDDALNQAMCGVSNKPTLDNFRRIGEKFFKERKALPVLTASTLLVPGYVDVEEVRGIAGFIADIDVGVPYTLLAFYPAYVMDDLPTTSRREAEECYNAAKGEGLERVRVGNVHLLC